MCHWRWRSKNRWGIPQSTFHLFLGAVLHSWAASHITHRQNPNHHDEFAPQDTRRLARRFVPVRHRNIDPRTAPRLHPFEPELSAEKTMNAATTDEYDAFASDYHWLYSDRVLSGAPFVDSYATVLRSLPPQARILDCACGIGIHSLALARHGYDVRSTDASGGMIAEARRRAALEGLGVEFAQPFMNQCIASYVSATRVS